MDRIKHILLLPLNFNDGNDVPRELHEEILEKLFVLAGGYYIAGEGEGAYRMGSGQKQVDRVIEVWVVVAEDDIPELRELVAEIGALLDQESMYFERAGGTVSFVPPSK